MLDISLMLAVGRRRSQRPDGDDDLIYRARKYEGDSKDCEFSRQSMEEHWRAGYHDTVRTLQHPEVLERPRNRTGLFIFDIDGDGRE